MAKASTITVNPGDTVELTQKDGKIILILVAENEFRIKAPDVGTELAVTRDSSFCIYVKTVKARSAPRPHRKR